MLIGGRTTNDNVLKSIEVFDCRGDRGTQLIEKTKTLPNLKRKRKNLSSIILGDRYLFVFCGKQTDKEEIFSTTMEWLDLRLNQPKALHSTK